MAKYRENLPQMNGKLFLSDGGMGTSLIFHAGLNIPYFCTFPLLEDSGGRDVLVSYFRDYAAIARDQETGFILDSGPTWRASTDWGIKLGYSSEDLVKFNRIAIEIMSEIRNEYESEMSPMVISGCMGPRGDGYEPGDMMNPNQAQRYHVTQVETFADTQADQVTAMTMTYSEEAAGLARAAQSAGMPAVISFTVETDGRLPTGQSLGDAINYVDDMTAGAPAYYMINCAHPSHFRNTLESESNWTDRIRGIRLNASCLSHTELNEATELDDGDVTELGAQVGNICENFPHINVVGGCCGTDHRHIKEIGENAKRARS